MLSLKSVGFSTSRLHTVHIVLSDNGCDKCICSLSESSNVISVVSKAQWKSYILKCMKSQKSNVCYQNIGKCLALVFCRTVFVSWWRVYLLASSCLNWCLVEHSSVKTQRHLLVCLFLTHLLSHKTLPLNSTSSGACKDVYNVFIFFLCEKNSELFALSFLPPFRSLCKVYITMVLFYTILCNLPL